MTKCVYVEQTFHIIKTEKGNLQAEEEQISSWALVWIMCEWVYWSWVAGHQSTVIFTKLLGFAGFKKQMHWVFIQNLPVNSAYWLETDLCGLLFFVGFFFF